MLIAGVDEAGRGPLAGAVVAAAVILDPAYTVDGVTDSKKLTARKRDRLELEIKQHAIAWAIGRAEVDEIDKINILQATLLAMRRAVEGLSTQPTHVQVDGNQCPQIDYPVEAIVKGDGLVAAIGAASILAKVARDRELIALDEQYPEYGFAQHKGYPTRGHIAALERHGVSPAHRRSFGPVHRLCKRAF